MYHYTECGLPNVWLGNGYKFRKTSSGEVAVSIMDADKLHISIGRELAARPRLTGAGFRYLRKELGLSQNRLAEAVGASVESVSLWERTGKIPKSADRIVRAMYLEKIDGNVQITKMIERLIELDNKPESKLVFEDTDSGWRMAA